MTPRPILRAALIAATLVAAVALGDEPELRIGQVRIRALDVFSPSEAERGWIYRAANSLRFETRHDVIRKFLLFAPGDPYNPARLAETERNLRALPFLKSASVTASPPREGVVDVDVVTQDAWTTDPGLSLGGKGGTTTYGFELKEKDFLGTGRQLSIGYQKGTERIRRVLQYRDPYLFGPYWSGSFGLLQNSDGSEQRVDIARPFFSFIDPWSAAVSASNLRQDERVFGDGRAIAIFHQKHRELALQYGRAIEATDERARRLTAGIDLLDDSFSRLANRPEDEIPDPRKFRYVFLQYEDVVNDFLKASYVNRDSRYEDFELGLRFLARVAVSPSLLGVPRTTELVHLEASDGWRLGARGFLQAALTYETRYEGAFRNQVVTASLFSAWKFETALLQTLVSRLEFDRGWRLDRDVQFIADGDNGLRGYPLHAFAGNRRVVWNLEHRVFSGRELLQLVSPGAVVFFDSGTAVPEGRPLRISEFKTDVGIGLRFAISRASTNSVVRIDLAYPLNPDASGKQRLIVSFSSGQVF